MQISFNFGSNIETRTPLSLYFRKNEEDEKVHKEFDSRFKAAAAAAGHDGAMKHLKVTEFFLSEDSPSSSARRHLLRRLHS